MPSSTPLSSHRSSFRLATLLLPCAVLLAAGDARAGDDEAIAGVVAVTSIAAADLSFAVRASALAANGGDAQSSYSWAQTLFTTPQAIGFNGAMMGLMSESDAPEIFAALHVPTTMTTALAAHGMWSLARPDEDQTFMFLASTHIGVNTMWTSFALGTGFSSKNRFADDDAEMFVGIYEVLTTGPGVGIGIHQAMETSRFRAGWITLSAWSGMLTLHGALFAGGLLPGSYDDCCDDYASTDEPPLGVTNLGIAPTSMGPPVEGAPDTPGFVVTGAF